jgi:hypothetical protein
MPSMVHTTYRPHAPDNSPQSACVRGADTTFRVLYRGGPTPPTPATILPVNTPLVCSRVTVSQPVIGASAACATPWDARMARFFSIRAVSQYT